MSGVRVGRSVRAVVTAAMTSVALLGTPAAVSASESLLENIAHGKVNPSTRYVMMARPSHTSRREDVGIEVQFSAVNGEEEDTRGAFSLRAAPARWSMGAVVGCAKGMRYAVVAVMVRSGDRVTIAARNRHYQLRPAKLPFALKGRSVFLYGAVPWAPTELTLRSSAGMKITSEKWTDSVGVDGELG